MNLISAMVNEWIQKWKEGCLSCEDISKWEEWIPQITDDLGILKNPLETNFQNSTIHENLITAFEEFIFHGYSKDSIDEMCKRGESTICDKTSLLNSAMFYYTCMECKENDALRALCGDCFENSEHRRHKYHMFSSSSVYCCCGETKTWEKEWYCSKHKSENQKSLPEDVENRAGLVIETIVQYIDRLVEFFRSTDECAADGLGRDDMFCVTIYTCYDVSADVYSDLTRRSLLKMNKRNYLQYLRAWTLEGKITVKLPKKTLCETLKAECTDGESQVGAKIFHIHDVVLQNLILAMAIYLRKLLKYGSELRRKFVKSMLTSVGTANESVAEKLLIFSSALPVRILAILHELLMFGMIKEYETKEIFSKMLTERYEVITGAIYQHHYHYLGDIMNQLFTVPNLAHQLIANENILSVVLTAFLNRKNEPLDEYSIGPDNFIYSRSVQDLEVVQFLLTTLPKIWTKELRAGFLNGFTCFLRVLNNFQEIGSEIRATKQYEENRKHRLDISVISTTVSYGISSFFTWCGSDSEVFDMVYTETQMMINQRICSEPDNRTEKTVELLTYNTKCLPYDSAVHPVSAYLPLFRFFVGLFGIRVGHYTEIQLDAMKTIAVSKLFDPVLRIQSRFAQDAAGMWKRNGDSLMTNFFYYSSKRAEIFNRDVQLLQIVASVTEPNEFLIQILEKFGLIDWANPNYEENSNNLDEVTIISAKFLQLLINVLVERDFPGTSYVAVEDYLKHQIIQFLCIKPACRSDVKHFIGKYGSEEDLTKVLQEIAILKKPTSISENGIYELTERFFDRYNPLYYHYHSEEISEANEFQRNRRKAAGEPDCFPPPQLPKLKEFFAPMVNVFQCDVMLHIMCTVLERFVDLKSKSSTETHVEHVLYLIGYALQEEQSNRYPMLSFTKEAAKWNLLKRLEETLSSNRENLPKDLLKWTVTKYKEVAHVTTEAVTTIVSENDERAKKSQAALAKRAKIMEEIVKMQMAFMNINKSSEEEFESDEDTEHLDDATEKTCVLCHETQKLDLKRKVLVMPGYYQHSTVLCRQRKNKALNADSPLLTANIGPSIYTSSCGHVMHSKCLQRQLERMPDEEDFWNAPRGFDKNKGEFLCPFCESLSNTVLPLLPPSISLDDNLKEVVLKFTANFQSATRKNALNVWKSLSYTVHVVEAILRDSNKPILGHLSSRYQACLEYFVNVAAVATQLYPNDDFYDSYIENLRSLLRGETSNLTTHLRLDMFSLFVTLLLSETERNETIRFQNICLVFVAQIVKTLIETDFDGMVDDVKSKTETPFKHILRMLGKDLSHLSESFVWTFVQQACLPFLRRCVLFFSFLTDVPAPVDLTQSGGDTFANMCFYLKLPQTPEELFDRTYVLHVQNWFKHPYMKTFNLQEHSTFEAVDPHHINQLIELPQEYFEICRMVASFRCPNNDNEIEREPHLCLVCGEMLCTEACCYKFINGRCEGSFDVHSRKCSSVLYFNVIDNEIVLRLPHKSHWFHESYKSQTVPGPYLDEFYESDCCFDKSSPRFLSAEKYKKLHSLWLNHEIFEKISRLSRSQ